MANLGTLTIDLIAKTSNYVEGLGKAARQTERNTREMQRSLRQLEKQAEATRLAFKATIAGFLTAQTGRSLIEIGDNYKAMGERIKAATNNLEEYDYVQKRLLSSANTSFRSLAEAQELFIATTGNLRGTDYNYTLSQSMDIVDSLSYAFVRNATAADKAKTAINIYDRALATGKLTSQDWQSVNSAVPTLAKNIGDAFGKTAEEVNKLGMSGKLTTSEMNEGLLKSLQDNEDAANSMVNTVVDALTKWGNEFSSFWGELNQEIEFSSGVANSIIFFADNLKYAKDVVIALSVVMVAKASPAIIANTLAIKSNVLAHTGLIKTGLVTDYTVARITNQTRIMSSAMAASAATTKILSSALALIGGPTGAIVLATTGLLMFSGNSSVAKKSVEELKIEVEELEKRFHSMNRSSRDAAELSTRTKLQSILDEKVAIEDQIAAVSSLIDHHKKLNDSYGGNDMSQKTYIAQYSNELIRLDGRLSDATNKIDILNQSLGIFSNTANGSAEKTVALTGKALDLYENLNKQAFMLANTGKDAELMYQRQYGYLKDITDEQYKLIDARRYAVALLEGAKANEKELASIVSSVTEQYNNMGLSTNQVMLNRLLDLDVTLEQFAVIKAMIGAIDEFEAGKPKGGGRSSINYFDDKLKSIELILIDCMNYPSSAMF